MVVEIVVGRIVGVICSVEKDVVVEEVDEFANDVDE